MDGGGIADIGERAFALQGQAADGVVVIEAVERLVGAEVSFDCWKEMPTWSSSPERKSDMRTFDGLVLVEGDGVGALGEFAARLPVHLHVRQAREGIAVEDGKAGGVFAEIAVGDGRPHRRQLQRRRVDHVPLADRGQHLAEAEGRAGRQVGIVVEALQDEVAIAAVAARGTGAHDIEIGQLRFGEGIEELAEMAADEEAEIVQGERFLLALREACDQIAVAGEIEGAEVQAVAELIVAIGAGRRGIAAEQAPRPGPAAASGHAGAEAFG